MARKFNNKKLGIIFIILIAVLVANNFFQKKKGNRSFKNELVQVDSGEIASFTVMPKVENGVALEFSFENGKWWVSKDKIKSMAEKSSVENLFNMLNELKPKRLASTMKDKWAEYEATDSLGTRIILYDKEKEVIGDLVIGKISFNQRASTNQFQQQPQMQGTSFVRLYDEDEIYAVEGFISLSVNQNFTNWRMRKLSNIASVNDITTVSISTNDQQFSLSIPDSIWKIRDEIISEKQVNSYLSNIRSLSASGFDDTYDGTGKQAKQYVQIEGNNFSPIRIDAFPKDSTYVFQSSINPGTFYKDNNLYEKLFKGKEFFLEEDVL